MALATLLGTGVTNAQGAASIELPVYDVRYQLVAPKYAVTEYSPYNATVTNGVTSKVVPFSLTENNKTLVVTL